MKTMTEREYVEHNNNSDGICTECFEISDGGCEPDAENYECEHCGCKAVTGIENALITGIIGIQEEKK